MFGRSLPAGDLTRLAIGGRVARPQTRETDRCGRQIGAREVSVTTEGPTRYGVLALSAVSSAHTSVPFARARSVASRRRARTSALSAGAACPPRTRCAGVRDGFPSSSLATSVILFSGTLLFGTCSNPYRVMEDNAVAQASLRLQSAWPIRSRRGAEVDPRRSASWPGRQSRSGERAKRRRRKAGPVETRCRSRSRLESRETPV